MKKQVLILLVILWSFFMLACDDNGKKQGFKALEIGDYERARVHLAEELDKEVMNADLRYAYALATRALAEEVEKQEKNADALWWEAERNFKIYENLDSSGKENKWLARTYYALARQVRRGGNLEYALSLLDRAVVQDSTIREVWNLRGLVYYDLGMFEKMEEDLERCILLDPYYEAAYLNLGHYYREIKMWDDAVFYYQLGAESLPESGSLRYWMTLAQDSLFLSVKPLGAK
jgi:tetratricopeptide (TPR) repeat protein